MSEIRLDVSDLEPCEPMERSLAAVSRLGPGEWLRVLHRREPHLLYPLLESSGCRWHCRPGTSSAFEILIWRADDQVAEAAVAQRLGVG